MKPRVGPHSDFNVMTDPSKRRIVIFFVTAFLSVCSGIIASSDGITLFNVTEAIVERREIAVAGEHVRMGVGGKRYSKYGIALSVAAIPLYLVGKVSSTIVPEQFRPLTMKGSVSLTNAVLSAFVCLLLVKTAQALGYSSRVSFQLAMSFAFSTLFVVYATKSFLTQPLETLCLVGSLCCLISYGRDGDRRTLAYAGAFCGTGILTKWAFIVNLPILAAYALAVSSQGRRARDLLAFLSPAAFLLGLALWYNAARFGSVLETGYRPSVAFTEALPVGLYGLLFSSGKSLFLYAPIAVLGITSMKAFARTHKREAWLLSGLFATNLILIAKFVDWGGEGSWGPRYLTSVLPCLVLPIGALLQAGSVAMKRSFLALSLAGLVVQFGGVSIYYGTYYRVIGEFPYQYRYSDPLFFFKARYVPSFSPAWGQFKMARANWIRFLTGQKPAFTVRSGSERIPLSTGDIEKLRGTLDLWFAYAYYAGVPFGVCMLGMTGLLAAAGALGWRTYRSTGGPAG